MDIADVMNYMVEHSAPNLPAEAISDILDRLSWSLDETEVFALAAVAHEWLIGPDPRRAEISLARTDAFPADNRDDLVALMAQVAARHPGLEPLARRKIEHWDQQFSRRQ
ncbi:hypothetical protein [Catenulispora subtropica]|uniref:Uncharacterized protein n=1 Tax=Catenulispora subtropica TaxID=450798 RepID=A0ABN2SEK7_9ACTN